MIKVILWDMDGTLLDFKTAEYYAIKRCFSIFNLGECSDEQLEIYSAINDKYWKRLERGEMTKPEILVGRFVEFFQKQGIDSRIAEAFNQEYQLRLGDTICFFDEGDELLKRLSSRVKQYIVTNGTARAQERKIAKAGFEELVDGIFISEHIGVEKPGKGFFDAVFSQIGDYELQEILIVGDSLTSDMLGGVNAGIKTCWYNPHMTVNTSGLALDYEIKNLQQIEAILDELPTT